MHADILPASPRAVRLTVVTSHSATLQWAAPSVNADKLRRYAVRYRRLDGGGATERRDGEVEQVVYLLCVIGCFHSQINVRV